MEKEIKVNKYPTEEELEFIKNFNILKEPPVKLAKYIQSIWHWGEDYCPITAFKDEYDGREMWKFEMHTGGWSGNEDIVLALRENWMFWNTFWTMSKRGGHYWFELPIKWELESTK